MTGGFPFWRRKPAEAEEIIDAAPMPSIFERPAPPPLALLTVGELIPPLWTIADGDGAAIGERVRFMPDGRLLAGPGGRWEQIEGRLLIRAAGGEAWVFDRRETIARRDTIQGRIEGSGATITMRRDLGDLQTVHALRRPDDPLLVVFNSSENPFDGAGTRWEFSEWIDEGAVDFVLVSERADPAFSFLNKTARVVDRLRHLLSAGYREILFLGCGSGGFAAMMFAELLSYEGDACRMRSVTLNPQTQYGPEHDEAIAAATDPAWLPPFVEADALSQKDTAFTSIRELVRTSTRRRGPHVEHRVLYDRANPAQAYYAHSLDDLTGFGLQPLDLGLPHRHGVDEIGRSQAFHDAMRWGRER